MLKRWEGASKFPAGYIPNDLVFYIDQTFKKAYDSILILLPFQGCISCSDAKSVTLFC